jgi:tetratricopeptide (TPR) repeat protein
LSGLTEPTGSIDAALAHAKRLLEKNPDLAAEQAREILSVMPAHPMARLILGAAQRRGGRASAAVEILEPLALEQPQAAPVHLELGVARAESGFRREAIASLRLAVQLQPASPDGWRLLADHLEADGDAEGADACRVRYVKVAVHVPRLKEAATALSKNDLPRAEALLRAHLDVHANDIAALRMLAEVAGRLRRYEDAVEMLERCLRLAPSFDAARQNYAGVLNRQSKPAAALPHVERLLAKDPGNLGYSNLKAAILANLGDYRGSIDVYAQVLNQQPRQPKIWMSMAHGLKTAGRKDESVAAYRRAIQMEPTLGEAYWSLANLKTFRFSGDEIRAMQAALDRAQLADEDRVHFEFALGKALEDEGSYEASFMHYASGNAAHRGRYPYSAEQNRRFTQASKRWLTPDFFAARRGAGTKAPDPIFIVGLPRAGSTLIEQILASHPAVEGTIELPDIPQIARDIAGDRGSDPDAPEDRFFRSLAALGPEDLSRLGERYLESTRVHRKTDKPFFVDKMPNNCLYVGLIHLILPNARIIDARRHPLGCCLSAFKQHFSRGQSFTYDLEDLGRYYGDYAELMAHVDAALPGRVHRIFHESMVHDTEGEIRRLLDHCGLPFDERCLRFFENDRPVRTASSEQVRRPIFTDGLDQWRNFEPWLDPLKRSLGEVLTSYPAVPSFALES